MGRKRPTGGCLIEVIISIWQDTKASADGAHGPVNDEPEVQPIDEARLVEQIKAVCAEWPAYGYRRVTAELHDEGRVVNHKKVMRLMRENGLTVPAGISLGSKCACGKERASGASETLLVAWESPS